MAAADLQLMTDIKDTELYQLRKEKLQCCADNTEN